MSEMNPGQSRVDAESIDSASEERIQKIMDKTRHETSAADLMTFVAGRAWSVLLILGAAFVVVASKFAQGSEEQDKQE